MTGGTAATVGAQQLQLPTEDLPASTSTTRVGSKASMEACDPFFASLAAHVPPLGSCTSAGHGMVVGEGSAASSRAGSSVMAQ